MKETTQLRKSFLGGYRREDVQEYFDELYEEAEKKYKDLADEHDRLAQENVLLRQWIGDDQDQADGLNLPDLHSEAAFDLPEGVYQFDPSSNKVLDLTHSSEPVEFKAVAAGHSFDVPAGLQKSDDSSVKLTVLPNKAVEVKAKSEATPKKVVKELAQKAAQKVAQEAAQVEEAAEATVETESASKKTVESKPQLDYEQKVASEKVRQPKRYYVKGRSKSAEAQVEPGNASSLGQATAAGTNSQASTSFGETFTNAEHATNQGFSNGQAPQYQAAPQPQYQMPNQPSFNGQPYQQTYQQPYPTQGYQSPQFFQAPPAYYPPVQYSGQPMYQTAPVDTTLLARVEKLEAELTQTRAQLEFANGLLKELYK